MTTTYPTLACMPRNGSGSSASRQLRQQDLLPATVYGLGESQSLVLEQRHFAVIEHSSHSGSKIVHLLLDGVDGGLALVKTIQRHAIKKTPMHVDLQRISLLQYLDVTVTVHLDGTAAGIEQGGVLEIINHALSLRCLASAVPEYLRHDITALGVGDTLTAGQILLPEGCELTTNPEDCVAVIRLKAE